MFIITLVVAILVAISIRHKRLRLLAPVLCVAITVAASAVLFLTEDEIDKCLDAGGAWWAKRSQCTFAMPRSAGEAEGGDGSFQTAPTGFTKSLLHGRTAPGIGIGGFRTHRLIELNLGSVLMTSRIIESVREDMASFHKLGMVDDSVLAEFNALIHLLHRDIAPDEKAIDQSV